LDFKIRDDTLIVSGFFRSQDIGKKMYADALELLNIGHAISKELDIVKNISIIHFISSAHIYKEDITDMYKIFDKENIPYKIRFSTE